MGFPANVNFVSIGATGAQVSAVRKWNDLSSFLAILADDVSKPPA
jgi:hypothetical protein